MAGALWAPDRRDIIWIDCNPRVGREIKDLHPMFANSCQVLELRRASENNESSPRHQKPDANSVERTHDDGRLRCDQPVAVNLMHDEVIVEQLLSDPHPHGRR